MKMTRFLKNDLYVTIVIIVFIQVILMFQGFDICDDGFVLTFYQQIFSNPESVEYNFLYWFSGVLGGLWHQLNEDGGIIWFRVLGIVTNTSTFILSFEILKKYMPRPFLIFSLLMVLFVNDYGFLTFYHNQITSLLTVLMVYFLSKGLLNQKYKLLIIVGFIFVLNGMTRLPNFILISLFLGIPVYFYLENVEYKSMLKPIGFSVLGVFLGFFFVYLFLSISGQLHVMENALFTMMDVGNTEGSAHNFKSVIKAQYYNHYNIVIAFFQFAGLFLITTITLIIVKRRKYLLYLIAMFFGGLLVYWFQRNGIFSIYTLAYIGSIWTLFSKRFNTEIRIIALMAFIMLATMTLGSGGGIKNSGYMTIWLGFPLFYFVLQIIVKKIMSSTELTKQDFNAEKKSLAVSKLLVYALTISFLTFKAYNISNGAYFDSGSRLDKTFAINSKKAKYIYTTEARAKIVNNLLANLEHYVEPGDYLFAYDHIPMVHYLTSTLPYTYNPWPGIYDHYSFKKKIEKAETEIDELPIVVVQKFETIIEFSEPIPEYMVPEKNNSILHGRKSIELMNDFLKRNYYEEVWSDNYFSIYKSDRANN
ncbi:hypothetical protein [Winogradskyella ouciana]|uniref:Glycosyltransferase RgtA/B/C/D-like domain-containing protein n=1 Tax=Winogradskyella ouciana TaxID=2608631 RepID=A0A7K1GEC1_9FLAO|nr:hypothetical protein [Winogradskyella ouciana]MTE26758.1 hypothetical protein [Winogradskyella ouciana]